MTTQSVNGPRWTITLGTTTRVPEGVATDAFRPIPGLPEGTERLVAKWLQSDDTGTSSKAIVAATTGLLVGYSGAPYDPSDLTRCIKLLDAVPVLKRRMGRLRKVSGMWSAMVDNWDDLTTTLAREKAERTDGMAPETYAKMLKIRGVKR